MILGGKAYKNLRRKGGEKYREVYLRWVAKPIEKIDRKSEKSNKKSVRFSKNHEILEISAFQNHGSGEKADRKIGTRSR